MRLKKLFFIFIIIFFTNIFYCNYSYATIFNANSPSAILLNSNTGKILYEKNAYTKMYPASTTKIMTAILVLENCNLSDTAIVSENATILPSGYIGASLQIGEELSIKDLLYLLLLASANDSAIVLAEHVGGSVDNFADMMNSKAKEIGCLNTHFVNPNGIHNTNHYSTAYDLALIGKYAMANDVFKDIVSCKFYTVKATNKYQERNIYNTNKLLHESNPKNTDESNIFYYNYVTGIKTGYTTVAKNCLVASAKKDDIEYIAVILGSDEYEDNYNSQRYSDAKNLFSNAIDNYCLSTIKKSGDIITNLEIQNGDFLRKNLDLKLKNDIKILIKNEDLNIELTPEVILNTDALQAPISKGDVLGSVTYVYDNISYSEDIIASHDVSTNEQMSFYFKLALGSLIIIFTFTFYETLRKK